MSTVSFAYEVILKETQPKVGLSKSSGSDQKQTLCAHELIILDQIYLVGVITRFRNRSRGLWCLSAMAPYEGLFLI